MLLFDVIKDFSYVQEGQTIYARKGQRVRMELRSEVERALRMGFVVATGFCEPRPSEPKSQPAASETTSDVADELIAGAIVRVKRKKGEPRDAEIISVAGEEARVRFDDGKTATVKLEDVLEVIA